MAVHGSVIKRARQNTKARQRNRSWKSRIKTQQKRIEDALAQKDTNALADLYREYCSLVDKAASRKILHKNNASRKKTKMHLRIQDAMSPSLPSTEGELTKGDKASKKKKPAEKAPASPKKPSAKKSAPPKGDKAPKEDASPKETGSLKETTSPTESAPPKEDASPKGDEAPKETESLKETTSPTEDPSP